MKITILTLLCCIIFLLPVYAEENQIDPLLLNTLQGGIAVESYLDGVFNESIGTAYFDFENKKILYASIIKLPPPPITEPATLAVRIFNITAVNVLEPKRVSFAGTNEAGYTFVADASALNSGKIIFYLKVSGRGIVEIKNISKKGLELHKKWAPGVYLGETNK
jgi:hypothetical protein